MGLKRLLQMQTQQDMDKILVHGCFGHCYPDSIKGHLTTNRYKNKNLTINTQRVILNYAIS